jgi:hypothetical protein
MTMQSPAERSRRLPGWLLAQLFPDSIVQTSRPSAAPPATETLGGNGKRILIGVVQPDAAVIREADLSFLLNILHACRLGMPDVRLINLAHTHDNTHQTLSHDHDPVTVILFGASASDIGLPMRFPDYQVQDFQGVRYLTAPDLPALETDMAAKKKLWVALKQLFPA